MMSLGLCSTSDVIAFDHNYNNLGLTSAGGKDLSSHIKITVLGSMEPEIWMKILKNWSEKLKQNSLPLCVIIPWQKIPVYMYDDAFSSPVEDQSLQQ